MRENDIKKGGVLPTFKLFFSLPISTLILYKLFEGVYRKVSVMYYQ